MVNEVNVQGSLYSLVEEILAANHTSSKNGLSPPPLNYYDDSSSTSMHINHDGKNENRLPQNYLNGYAPANTKDASKTSHSTSQHLNFATGIRCEDSVADPRLELRGTNYWTLYNYIPADKAIKLVVVN